MSRRLGEILIEAGKLTEAQLHRALTSQLVFGGHVGTSLLELGCLDEETLGETLASMFGVSYADFDTLSRVPYSVIRSLPAKLVEKHKVVPLRLEGKTLHLAMIDPKNLLALDEISFVTGYRIVPWVAPEVRVLQVLEKYYNLPRTQRFTILTRELARLKTRRERLRPLQSEAVFLDEEAKPQRQTARVDTAVISQTKRSSGAVMMAPAARTARGSEAAMDHWTKYGYGRSWRELADALEAETPSVEQKSEEADTRPQPRTLAAPAPSIAAPSLMESARLLAESQSVDGVISSTLAYMERRVARCLFFVTRGDRIVGWAGRGDGVTPDAVQSLSWSQRDGSSIFHLVGQQGDDQPDHYLGTAPTDSASMEIYRHLGGPVPRTLLVVPINVKGRVTGYLYGDSGHKEMLALDIPAVLALCSRAGFALQILILRNKILSI